MITPPRRCSSSPGTASRPSLGPAAMSRQTWHNSCPERVVNRSAAADRMMTCSYHGPRGLWREARMAHVQTHSYHRLKILLSVSLFISASLLLWQPTVAAQGRGGVLRIGMTASDIPNTAGQPDQGGEGLRFVGYQMYDALVNWDLRQGDRPAELMPGLAERWEVRA